MEQNSAFLSLLASSIYVGGSACWRLWKRHQAQKERLFVVLTSRKCGLTTAISKMEYDTDNVILIDGNDKILSAQAPETRAMLEHMLNNDTDMFSVKFYPLVKQYITQLREIHRNKPIILFTSDVNLIKYLKLPDRQVATLMPSLAMFSTLVSSFKPEDSKLLTESREKLLGLHFARFTFKNFKELEGMLAVFLQKRK